MLEGFNRNTFALGIAAKILLLFAKDCSVKPDPLGERPNKF